MPSKAYSRLNREYVTWSLLITRFSEILQPTAPTVPTDSVEGQVLARAILTGLVNTFETYLAELMLEIYVDHPVTLKSNATVTVEEVLNFDSILEFAEFEANRRISRLARGAIEGYAETFRRQYQLDIFTEAEQPRARTLFEIRNLYTHRNGRVDVKFQANNPGVNVPIGEEYFMSMSDLLDAAQFLLTVADRLDQAAIAKYQLNTASAS